MMPDIVVVERAGHSMGLAFMVVFVAFPLGVAVALHAFNAPLSAITSFLQQGVDLLAQICASLLTLLFHIITFAIQASLNLLKSIVTSSFRALASRSGKLAGNFCNKFVEKFKAAIKKMNLERITRLLQNSTVKRQRDESVDSLCSLMIDHLFKLYEKITSSTGKDISDDIASFINDSLEEIASGIARTCCDKPSGQFVKEFCVFHRWTRRGQRQGNGGEDRKGVGEMEFNGRESGEVGEHGFEWCEFDEERRPWHCCCSGHSYHSHARVEFRTHKKRPGCSWCCSSCDQKADGFSCVLKKNN